MTRRDTSCRVISWEIKSSLPFNLPANLFRHPVDFLGMDHQVGRSLVQHLFNGLGGDDLSAAKADIAAFER